MEVFAFCRAEDIRPGLQEVNGDHEARKARTRMSPSGGGRSGQDFWVHLRFHQTAPDSSARSQEPFGKGELGRVRGGMSWELGRRSAEQRWFYQHTLCEVLQRGREATHETKWLPSLALAAAQQKLRIWSSKTPGFKSKELELPESPSSSCVTLKPPSPLYPIK